uniref:Metallo-beta-lactamase domain-containing protein 1 n=1 Tax=Culicoides sonorensis TaxID=179676 RepID=A0A336L1U3_CULSO
MNKITVLFDGYSEMLQNDPRGEVMKANCSCTLIQCNTGENLIVDSMDCWSGPKLLEALKSHNLCPADINFCISTHTHPDHLGNNNLFLNARHIVAWSVSHRDEYFIHDFTEKPFKINENIKIIATKGHTLTCISVICENTNFDGKTVAIVGDLFEHENDITDPELWKSAGSEAINDQLRNRHKMSMIADYIVPGHGPMFKVTQEIRKKLEDDMKNADLNIS